MELILKVKRQATASQAGTSWKPCHPWSFNSSSGSVRSELCLFRIMDANMNTPAPVKCPVCRWTVSENFGLVVHNGCESKPAFIIGAQ
jgi:hypothetical protein